MSAQAQEVDYARLAGFAVRGLHLPGAEPEDLHQEACLGIVEALTSWNPERGPFTAFAVLCGRRRAYDAITRANCGKSSMLTDAIRSTVVIEGREVEVFDAVADPAPGPEERLEVKEELARLARAYRTLSSLEERSVRLRVLGWSQQEIEGCKAGEPSKSVDNALHRAYRKFRDAT